MNTGERLTKIETTLDYLKENQDSQVQMIKDFIKSADMKYANKTVETVVYSIVGLILVSFFYALIYIVIPGLE
jgi:hypothetical protein